MVPIEKGEDLQAGTPQELFAANLPNAGHILAARLYDVTADGQRFLINELPSSSREEPITLVQNWTVLAERR